MCLLGSDCYKQSCTVLRSSSSVQYWEAVHLYSTEKQFICTVLRSSSSVQYWEAVHLYSTEKQFICTMFGITNFEPASNHRFTGFPRSVLVYKWTAQSIRTVNKENKTQHSWHPLVHPVGVVGHCGCDSRHASSFSHTEWRTSHTALTPMLTKELRDHWHCDWDGRHGWPSNHTEWRTKHTALTLLCLP